MKTNFLLLLICLMISCSEDYIGQYPIDKVPPGGVKNPVVTNFAGGSEIIYELPDDDDLLYVKAQYVLPDGTKAEDRASFLTNSMKLNGFGRSQETTIKLISVDRSKNESQPVLVKIFPEDSPIYDIISTVGVSTDWGGVKVSWENPEKENIILSMIVDDEYGEFSSLENFYTSEAKAKKAVRGMDTVEVNIGVFVRDRYNNFSDTIYSTHQPLYEIQLDQTKFKSFAQSPDYMQASWPGKGMSVLWDNAIEPEDNVYYIVPGGPPNPYFTMDLGVTVKLSRFKFWSRQSWIFQLHSPKHFEVWGTDDSAATVNDNWDGWILLMDQEAYRPSGLLPGEPPTIEDKVYAAEGEEYEFDILNPPVRYIRYRCIETWSGSTGLNLSEIAFWGAPKLQQ